MAAMIYPTVPVARPAKEPWPVDDHPLGIQADEMFARQLDNAFAGELRSRWRPAPRSSAASMSAAAILEIHDQRKAASARSRASSIDS